MSTALVTCFAPNLYFSSYPPHLQLALAKLCKHPDALFLLDKVSKQHGKIGVKYQPTNGQSATWDWEKKVIELNPKLAKSSAENQVAYILFELFNAANTDEFLKVINDVKNPELFVESFEKLEHESALKTRKLARAIFGHEAEFDLQYIFTDFHLHYALEQISGHSEEIAQNHLKDAADYQGTLYYPLSELQLEERIYLYGLLYHKMQKDSKGFTNYLDTLRAGAITNAAKRRAVDCALLLFPDCFVRYPPKSDNNY